MSGSSSPSFDGWRAAGFVLADRIVVQGRSGRDLTVYFPDVAQALARSLPPGAVVDGELVAFDGARTDFEALGQRVIGRADQWRPAHLVVFDLLQHPTLGVITPLPLTARRELLTDLLTDADPTLALCPQSDSWAVANDWFHDWTAAGAAEGVVVKSRRGPYRIGGAGWLKRRATHTVDLIIGGYTGTGERPDTLLLGQIHDGRLWYVGRTLPLTDRQARTVGPALDTAGVAGPPLWPNPMPGPWLDLSRPEPLVYRAVAPVIVVEVVADNAFDRGRRRYRHPLRFTRVRPEW